MEIFFPNMLIVSVFFAFRKAALFLFSRPGRLQLPFFGWLIPFVFLLPFCLEILTKRAAGTRPAAL
jgi:hypothetical protein